jgi:hypothetical protein
MPERKTSHIPKFDTQPAGSPQRDILMIIVTFVRDRFAPAKFPANTGHILRVIKGLHISMKQMCVCVYWCFSLSTSK